MLRISSERYVFLAVSATSFNEKKAPDLRRRFIIYDGDGLLSIAICDIHGCSSGIDLVAVT